MYKRFFTKVCLIFLILAFLFTTISLATLTVTEDNLNEALNEFEAYMRDSEYEFEIIEKAWENSYTMSINGVECKIEYDLTENPTFTYKASIYQGMSYDDYSTLTSNLVGISLYEFMPVAYIQGIEFEDSMNYFLLTYLANALSSNLSNSYVIVDDTTLDEGVTIEKDESDSSTLYVSEFNNWIMEYTNSIYGEATTIKDSSEGYGLYELTISQEDVTETSCTLTSVLTLKTDEDFSKIEGFADSLSSSFDFDASDYNIDYTIELEVGQKCLINTTEEIYGYELVATDLSGSIKISDDYSTITATSAGKAIYKFYIGDNTYTIYFNIAESNGENLDDVTLAINDNDTGTNDNTITPTTSLPSTGLEKLTYFLIVGCIVLIVLFKIKAKKYEYIK